MRAEIRSNRRVKPRPTSPWKGLLTGALAGLTGAFAMSQFHAMLPQNKGPSSGQNGEDSTVKAASAVSRGILHKELTAQQEKTAGPMVHYVFGMGMGSIYGMLVERAEPVRAGWGLPFGAAVWLGAHVITVPALGLSEPVTRSTAPQEASEFAAHLVYGAAVEGVRRFLRSRF